jgi:heptosyltransferase III
MEVERVLIFRVGSLGDTLVAFPCLHLIARTYPAAERLLLTNFPVHAKAPAAASVIGESGLVHGYLRYAAGTRSSRELVRLWREIRAWKPDVIIYLMPVRSVRQVRRDRWFFRLAGVRRIIGLPSPGTSQHLYDTGTEQYESEAHRLARTLRVLGDADPSSPASWNLGLTQDERDNARAALADAGHRPIIACGVGTKMQAKDWGVERWRELLGKLSRRFPDHHLVLVGAKEDEWPSKRAAELWTGTQTNLCGRLTPRETAAVMERASVFLGPDSGPMHFAAAAGIPAVIAFSARGRPGVWFPAGSNHQILYRKTLCWGCNLETCVEEQKRCLELISVSEMYHATVRALTGSKQDVSGRNATGSALITMES